MECDDRVDMLSFKTHMLVHMSTSGNVGVFMSPGARTPGALRLRHGAEESPAHEYLKFIILELRVMTQQGQLLEYNNNCLVVRQPSLVKDTS